MSSRAVLVLVVLAAVSTGGGEQKQIDAARAKYEALMEQAALLERQGELDEARRLHEKAQALGKRLKQRGEILDGLEQGIEALRRLGRHEEAQHLTEIAAAVREGEDREYKGRVEALFDFLLRRDDPEPAVKRQLEVMRWAVEILVEHKRVDAAELVERAMHALRLRMEGRNDPEARRIQAGAPGRENLAEALLLAERLLREAGRLEKAEAVEDVVRALLRKDGRKRHREHDERQEMILHRLHELEAQVTELEREIRHLRHELELRTRK
jgi:hypothetical protein